MFERYGSEQIRNVASLGGNIGSASPIGDSLPVLISLDATLVLDGLKSRKIEMSDYFVGYRQTKLRKNEFIKEIIIPLKSKNNIHKCYKISKRIDDDISREFAPLSDVRGSKNYRTKIVSNLLDRFWNEYNNKKVTVYDF